jgi:hypothetical protein
VHRQAQRLVGSPIAGCSGVAALAIDQAAAGPSLSSCSDCPHPAPFPTPTPTPTPTHTLHEHPSQAPPASSCGWRTHSPLGCGGAGRWAASAPCVRRRQQGRQVGRGGHERVGVRCRQASQQLLWQAGCRHQASRRQGGAAALQAERAAHLKPPEMRYTATPRACSALMSASMPCGAAGAGVGRGRRRVRRRCRAPGRQPAEAGLRGRVRCGGLRACGAAAPLARASAGPAAQRRRCWEGGGAPAPCAWRAGGRR